MVYLSIIVILREVDRSLEGLDGYFFSVGKVDSVIDAGGHPLADFLDGLEGGVEAQLDNELAAQRLAEQLQLLFILGLDRQLDCVILAGLEDETDALGLAQSVGDLHGTTRTCEAFRRI